MPFESKKGCGLAAVSPTSPSDDAASGPAHARHSGDVAVGFAADVIFKPQVVAQGVDKARLPILRVIFGIVNGDHVLELGRADLADALDGAQLVGMGSAGGVD